MPEGEREGKSRSIDGTLTSRLTDAQLEDVIEARDLLTRLHATLCQE
jgi:hypothetical protein